MVISPFDPTSMHAGLNESVLGPEGFVKQGIHSNKNAFPMLRSVDLKFSKSGDFRFFVEKNREILAKNRGIWPKTGRFGQKQGDPCNLSNL